MTRQKTDEELKAEFLAKRGATVCPSADRRPPTYSPLKEYVAANMGIAGGRRKNKGLRKERANLYHRSWNEQQASERESYDVGKEEQE